MNYYAVKIDDASYTVQMTDGYIPSGAVIEVSSELYGKPIKLVETYEDIEIPLYDEEGNPTGETAIQQNIIRTAEIDQEMVTSIIQSERNEKLKVLRSLREPLLSEVDIMINDLVLQVRDDREAIVSYRQALKDFTAPYRYVNNPDKAKAAIDDLDLDNISWPQKPE